MAFTAKILSWRFRHLNIVGCLLKRRPTKGGSQAPQYLTLATPLNSAFCIRWKPQCRNAEGLWRLVIRVRKPVSETGST